MVNTLSIEASRKINFRIVLLSGLLVGTLDILAAFTDYYISTGKGPSGVLRYIASGIFGQKAFTAGNMPVSGLLFHYIIAFSFTIFFFWLYPRVKFMAAQPVLTAIIYAIFMWTITTRIVIPLSNVTQGNFVWWKALKAIAILFFMISLPLSFIAKKYFRRAS